MLIKHHFLYLRNNVLNASHILGRLMKIMDLRWQLKLRETEDCKYSILNLKLWYLWYVFEDFGLLM
jgi:hypothetical protein